MASLAEEVDGFALGSRIWSHSATPLFTCADFGDKRKQILSLARRMGRGKDFPIPTCLNGLEHHRSQVMCWVSHDTFAACLAAQTGFGIIFHVCVGVCTQFNKAHTILSSHGDGSKQH